MTNRDKDDGFSTSGASLSTVDASSEYPAIDFQALLRQEKRKARQKQRERKESQEKEETVRSIVFGRAKETEKDETSELQSEIVVSTDEDWSEMSWPPFPRLDRVRHRVRRMASDDEQLDSVFYVSKFLSQNHEESLLKWLQRRPDNPDNDQRLGYWTTMTYGKRRVCLFECTDESPLLPVPLQQMADGLVRCGVFEEHSTPNHVLVNEYQSGQGILPHTDGPSYEDKTATISIGGTNVLLDFTKRLKTEEIGITPERLELQVLLEGHGSLVVFCRDAYSKYCHGIEACDVEYASNICANAPASTLVERGYRISLTFRHKKKTVSLTQNI